MDACFEVFHQREEKVSTSGVFSLYPTISPQDVLKYHILAPQDMLDMKRTLLDIYFHSAHIEPSSELAQAVLAFSNLLTSDFLDDDELGLRGLAMKSVQTWGAGQS